MGKESHSTGERHSEAQREPARLVILNERECHGDNIFALAKILVSVVGSGMARPSFIGFWCADFGKHGIKSYRTFCLKSPRHLR